MGAIKVSHDQSIYPEIFYVVGPSRGIQGPLNSFRSLIPNYGGQDRKEKRRTAKRMKRRRGN
jgi:hypothetical protein